jgi:non-specific serine/threonine protein kinase
MIREYGLDRLRQSRELDATRERFAAYYLDHALAAEAGLRTPAQRQWKGTLDLEADNFRAALAWALAEGRAGDASVLVRGLWLWFWLHGNAEEVRDWVGHGLACAGELEPRDRAWLLAIGGCSDILLSQFEDGAVELRNAETLFRQVGDRRGTATVKLVLGFGSAPLLGEAAAQVQLVEALALFEELDDLWGVGTTLHSMCRLRTVYDDYDGAGDLFERSLATVERLGDELGIRLALNNLAYAELAAGRHEQARRVLDRLLEHMDDAGILFALDEPLEILARLEHAAGEDECAVELLAAADGLRARLHTPLWPPALARHEQLLETLRDRLGPDAYDAARDRGAAIDPNELQALARALNRAQH